MIGLEEIRGRDLSGQLSNGYNSLLTMFTAKRISNKRPEPKNTLLELDIVFNRRDSS